MAAMLFRLLQKISALHPRLGTLRISRGSGPFRGSLCFRLNAHKKGASGGRSPPVQRSVELVPPIAIGGTACSDERDHVVCCVTLAVAVDGINRVIEARSSERRVERISAFPEVFDQDTAIGTGD